MSYINKTSLLVPSQLPAFIRDDPDYENFVLFLQAYYEWMEMSGNAVYGAKNLPNYYNIDTTLTDFLQYFKNDFLPFFPEGSLVDQAKLTKIANQLYKTKGTPSSYKFLFRVLYNSDVQLYNAKDYILRASDGKWTITKLLNLYTSDPRWLSAINYRVFGETSKGYATISSVNISNNITQVILSGIDRNFSTGEYVHVVDNHNTTVLINSANVRAQILGVVSSVTPDSNNPGSSYNVGDPVVFYGGLNPVVSNPIGASGYISSVTNASITSSTPIYKGQGYRSGSFTGINIISGSGTGSNANALVTTFDPTPYYVYLVPNDTIASKASIKINSGSYNFANLTNANANTKLVNALTFPILNTFGISATTITSGGSGYDATTTANAVGYYLTDISTLESLSSMGILGPVQISSGGLNYQLNDKILFSGGSGYGAYANVTSVSANGAIQQISYISDPSGNTKYPLGGMSYQNGLPTVSVNTATGSGASLYIPGLVGGDATFSLSSTSYGQVTGITLTNVGKDYVSTPNVSLRIEDLLVANVVLINSPTKGDLLYQGTLANQTFFANVDSISYYSANNYNIRVYNYNGTFNNNGSIYIARSGVDIGANLSLVQTTSGIYTTGRKIYGNGSAKATVNFSNGVQYGTGFYQNSDGQPSGYSLLESENYNNYAYILQVEKALVNYANTALSFLHPAGMKYNAYNLLKNNVSFHGSMTSEELSLSPLGYLLSNYNYIANVASGSSNTINFTNLSGSNIANVISSNSFVTIYTNGTPFYSNVKSFTANSITLYDNWVTSVPNVAIATASANSSIININSITNTWNVATGNTISYFSDFMHNYDSVSFDGVNYKQIVHVDQHGLGTTITVNGTYSSAQTGYLYFTQNVNSSNVWVSGITQVVEVVDLLTENGSIIITEDGRILLLG